MTSQELQVQQKRELEQKQEGTVPARSFIPNADTYETDASLLITVSRESSPKASVGNGSSRWPRACC